MDGGAPGRGGETNLLSLKRFRLSEAPPNSAPPTAAPRRPTLTASNIDALPLRPKRQNAAPLPPAPPDNANNAAAPIPNARQRAFNRNDPTGPDAKLRPCWAHPPASWPIRPTPPTEPASEELARTDEQQKVADGEGPTRSSIKLGKRPTSAGNHQDGRTCSDEGSRQRGAGERNHPAWQALAPKYVYLGDACNSAAGSLIDFAPPAGAVISSNTIRSAGDVVRSCRP